MKVVGGGEDCRGQVMIKEWVGWDFGCVVGENWREKTLKRWKRVWRWWLRCYSRSDVVDDAPLWRSRVVGPLGDRTWEER